MNPLQWVIPWEPSAVVILAMGSAAFFFIRKCARYPLHQKLFFWIGLASLYIVSQTQFDYYAEHAFFIHRFQHSVLHHLGPFLIALSGFPARWNRYGFLANPVVAVLLFSGLIIFWLLPSIHLIAMLDWRLYRLMNWGMVLNGLMFWTLVLSPAEPRLSVGCRIMMMLAIIPPQIVTGALLFLAPHDFYPVYSLCGRTFTEISPLADQQIGGLILWTTGPMMSVIGILIVARREWMNTKVHLLQSFAQD